MKQAKYKDIRPFIKTGDVICFGGKGIISDIIKKITNSPVSHIGMILSTNIIENIDFIQIAESTSINDGFAGVQFNRLSDHIRDYEGDIWWMPLKDNIRQKLDVIEIMVFLISQRGKEYDAPQAILSALDILPDTKEDLDKLFCSEYVTAAFEHVNLLKDINASEQTPGDVVNFDLYGDVCQLKGTKKDL